MGDLNEWRRQGRSSLMRFQPVFGPLGRGVPSFPAYFPVLALDRVLALPHGIIEEIEAHDTPLARLASDHLPVKAAVRLGARPCGRARGTPRASPPRRRRLLARLLDENGPRREAPARPRGRSRAAASPAPPPRRFPSPGPTPTTTASSPARGAARLPAAEEDPVREVRPDGDGKIDQAEYPLLDNFYWINYMQRD